LSQRKSGVCQSYPLLIYSPQNKPIKGTNDWKKYESKFDISKESVTLSFGVLLVGPGSVWINDVELNELSDDNRKELKDLQIDLGF
jgi:hypothetical protein